MTFTCTTLDDLAHVLLGYTSGIREGGRRQLNRKLHCSTGDHFVDRAHRLLCGTSLTKTIDFAAARVVGTDGRDPTMLDILAALVRLDIDPERLCLRCFDTASWSIADAYRTARALRDPDAEPIEVNLTWDQRAVIAYRVATTDDRHAPVPEDAIPQPSALIAVRLSAVSHAIVAGFVAADDDQDRVYGVNVEGIFGSDLTWHELRRQFPLSAYHAWAATFPDDDPSDPALLTPLRALFPLAKFWGFAAIGTEDDPNYEPDAGY
ncbi:hypothetical protein [Amycolatopsis sp. RTGN1]|uniref:hypothetical protein n=1 Tax=Amycolatopsis ponsaeliensis TaxID=2992142 RepID=UPI00254C7FD3|nr:hypothetical protein [Amycolatopsis sp. RTGN1]